MSNMTYKNVGVDYDAMDPFKRMAQLAARKTAKNLLKRGFRELEWSRGESVYMMESLHHDFILGIVEEGLGTKNLVADAMEKLTGCSYYFKVAIDAAAMIFNDMITLGVRPLGASQHLATGASEWFKNKTRMEELIAGWAYACDLAGCVWGGGETPTLKDIIGEEASVIAGSSVGIVEPKSKVIYPNIQHGDAIILIGSSGIHANGLTMARKIAKKLPDGYLTRLSDGRTYGDTLLDPTPIYVPFVEDCLDAGVYIHYAVNITGHGWRKLMRAQGDFTYSISLLPRQLPIFDFIQKYGPVDDMEAYGNLNMGAGFALYVPETHARKVLAIVERQKFPEGLSAVHAGHIERSDEKKVIIKPKNLEFRGSTLGVR
ncbi:hypothetical protein A3H65_02005 [Candidatus Giovannonibacteria bacterium RIFCSPLOWO2_02_FULL_45_14]|uniref:Phosphoribosylformylglycinamidine cyclo-ligase n=1 Tax=Candidatus Giovannonibacteria bacterium RIFCSPLOWO2_12_FULL_44_15 TaxID=1798364 RepID=A0A1F5Y1A6_9BACT|nr:MAG: hypothetical protein A3C75_01920 [Candidatus Giovannonibacteria bacterium RIFCSPHIGHO2_02_FULL_44_31]OGF77030.1 MAG: hypothetical protein A3E62_04170 [Candidatus Giovannonibacteria bacterium RIFCSPHIGHO2_12_FULL_44_29]OGF90737.1 MAG: hypothetical protein A3H65_02005 [Candidatus Giovannonibacteria bacterium RIFCSPLOWO2_02_FULL_45_14]OGF93863.1 MAG: hypothetical protein A3G54_03835 [Candidatus Giovannonibacteria bacterium RIFCSPLOWO2_12_FULL_44_15]